MALRVPILLHSLPLNRARALHHILMCVCVCVEGGGGEAVVVHGAGVTVKDAWLLGNPSKNFLK